MSNTYTFEVEITEGHDEWWEEITEDGNHGIKDVTELLENLFNEYCINASVKLTSFRKMKT